MNPIEKMYWIGKGVGWDNIPRRLYQSAVVRTGWLRQSLSPEFFEPKYCPLSQLSNEECDAQWHQRKDRFFSLPSSDQLRSIVDDATWGRHVERVAYEALAGKYQMFSHWNSSLGWPPNFHRDEINAIDWPVGPHWLETIRSVPPRNDLKLVWEPSRLSLAFLFSRAYRYDNSEKWAEAFWTLVDAWIEQNPVNQTVAWGCGQEVAFRLMAILFGAFSTLGSSSANPERLARVDLLAWQSAKRIDKNINYAISQENNHALSEALGLWTVGLLYPQLPESGRWVKRAKRIVEKEIARQIYDDGSYVQHSMAYHRVMLDDMLWIIKIGLINGNSFGEATINRVRKSVRWLGEFVDSDSGRVPNCGANDGANVLPLSCTDYLDYRPVLHAACKLLNVDIPNFGNGVWQEKALWLNSSVSTEANSVTSENHPVGVLPREGMWSAPQGGYHILRGETSLLMIRAGSYKDRPGQCDMLHVDVWNDGENVVRDTGSFRYCHKNKSIESYHNSVAAHSTVQVLGQEQMIKGPNFLWFRWPKTTVNFASDNRITCSTCFFCGTPYKHIREVLREGERYTISDNITVANCKPDTITFVARWQLTPNYRWRFQTEDCLIAESDGRVLYSIKLQAHGRIAARIVDGWESLYYAERSRILLLEVDVHGSDLETRMTPLAPHNSTSDDGSQDGVLDHDNIGKKQVDVFTKSMAIEFRDINKRINLEPVRNPSLQDNRFD